MAQSFHQRETPLTQEREETPETDSGEQTTNNEVDEGYVDVALHTMEESMARNYRSSERRQVSASTSATSGMSSHLVHSREQTSEHTEGLGLSSLQYPNRIFRLESENEWLYQRNAELQDEVETLKGAFTTMERENRQSTRRLQNELNTVQATLDDTERQNRSLEATIRHLKSERPARNRDAVVTGFPSVPTEQQARRRHSRGQQVESVPASVSTTDSMTTSVSADSLGQGHSRASSEGGTVPAPTHHAYHEGHIASRGTHRRVRKKVSWQDEVGSTAAARPKPLALIKVPGSTACTTSILKTSPTKSQHDSTLPGSPPSLSGANLTPALPSISGWARSHRNVEQGTHGERRESDTASPGPARSLYEELGGGDPLQPSASGISSTSGFPSWRRDTGGVHLEMDPGRLGQTCRTQDRVDGDARSEHETTTRTATAHGEVQNATVLDRYKAALEDRGTDFWGQIQFWCVVGIFVAGVLSKGRDGVMELGRRG